MRRSTHSSHQRSITISNLTKPEQDYLNERHPQPICTCGVKMTPGRNKKENEVFHICEPCRKIRKHDGTFSDFIDRFTIDSPNDPPVCTCGKKMVPGMRQDDKRIYYLCDACQMNKFLERTNHDQERDMVYEDYPIPPAPTCTCGKEMTLSPNKAHMQPYHECLDCGMAKFTNSPLFDVWEGMD